MQSLDEKSWNEFYLNDIFGFKLAKGDNQPKNMNQGRIPVVSAGETNNGVTAFVSNPDEGSVFQSGTVTVDMFGKAFWHGYDYCAVSHGRVNILDLNAPNNSSQFISTCIDEGTISKYSYNQMCSQKRLTRQKVMLPVTDSGEPDYEYMAEYTRQKRETMLDKYRKYVEAHIAELGELVEIQTLDGKEWNHFRMPEIFGLIQRGKRLKNADHVPGIAPYVSSTANNNGVDDYIEATPGTRAFGDCISLANSGSVGTAFYEPFEYVASDHVTALKTEGMSKYVYLFLTSTIEKQGSNFNFNREINDARIKNMQIMLPVTDSGEPDYAYMEQYAKNMMLRKYQQYLEFINRQNVAEVE